MAKRTCEKHPKYQGLRVPRARDEEGNLCPVCVSIYEAIKDSGVKETRSRNSSQVAVQPASVDEEPVAERDNRAERLEVDDAVEEEVAEELVEDTDEVADDVLEDDEELEVDEESEVEDECACDEEEWDFEEEDLEEFEDDEEEDEEE